MTDPNVVTPQPVPRCLACKLPTEVRDALHGDRFEGGMSFEALAMKYSLADHRLSESGLRRHFARHAPEPEVLSIQGGDADGNGAEAISTSFGNTADDALDGYALLEAGTRSLVEIIRTLEQEYRSAAQRTPQAADRLFDKLLKAQAMLARSVEQLHDARALREEFRKTVPQIVDRCASEACRSLASLMRENAKALRQDVVDVGNGTLSFDEFWNRLLRYENAWPMEVGKRMKVATTEALRAEEALK